MAAGHDIPFSCTCGTLKGTLRGAAPRSGTHATCHCKDCRAAEVYFDQSDPGLDGVGIFQTNPHQFEITTGQDQLAVMSFGEKNLLRWYAKCCNAPLCNTMRSPKFAFVGIRTNRLQDTAALGPIIARGFLPTPGGKPKHEGLRVLIWRTVSRIARARMSGSWKRTPFFNVDTLETVRPITVLPKGTRGALNLTS